MPLLFILLALTDAKTTTWNHLTRDVYINGVAATEQVLWRSKKQWLLDVGDSRSLLVMTENDGKLTLQKTTRKAFTFKAHNKAAVQDKELKLTDVDGTAVKTDDGLYIIHALGKTAVMTAHQGEVGVYDGESVIYENAPVWQALKEDYKPSDDAVETFAQVQKPTKLRVYFGTWCGDSRRSVPRLLKTIEAAKNKNLEVELIGVKRSFTAPWDMLSADRVTNVPTIIIEQDGEEQGRFIERPRESEAVEMELADMFRSNYALRAGAYDKGKLMAEGALVRRDKEGRLTGTEDWKLYKGAASGYHLWVRLDLADGPVDMMLNANDQKQASFLQVTEQDDDRIRRTRYYLRGGKMVATLRGSDTGVVKQEIGLEGATILETPSLVINGWLRGEGDAAKQAYVIDNTLGHLRAHQPGQYAQSVLKSEGGVQETRQVTESDTQWWLHGVHFIPLKVVTATENADVSRLVTHFSEKDAD